MANYRVVGMTPELNFLVVWIFKSYFLVCECAKFRPWSVSENWAVSLHSQRKICPTIQAIFWDICASAHLHLTLKDVNCEELTTPWILHTDRNTAFCVAVWKTVPTVVTRSVLDVLCWEFRKCSEREKMTEGRSSFLLFRKPIS